MQSHPLPFRLWWSHAAAAKGRINQRDLRLKFLWTSSSLQCGNCRSQLGILRVVRNGSPGMQGIATHRPRLMRNMPAWLTPTAANVSAASGLPPVSQARGTPLNVRAVLSNGASLAVTSPWTGQGVLYSPRNWLDLDAEQIVDTGVKTSHSFVGLFHKYETVPETSSPPAATSFWTVPSPAGIRSALPVRPLTLAPCLLRPRHAWCHAAHTVRTTKPRPMTAGEAPRNSWGIWTRLLPSNPSLTSVRPRSGEARLHLSPHPE